MKQVLALVAVLACASCTTTFDRNGESLRIVCVFLCVVSERDGDTRIERGVPREIIDHLKE